ncbi:MAG: LysE family transporter [Bacillota bacterium]
MNITSFLIYCVIVTFTPGPTNIVILSTVHNLGAKKAMEYTYGATIAFGILLSISAMLNTVLLTILPKIFLIMQIIGSLYIIYLAFQIYKMDTSKSVTEQSTSSTFISGFLMQFINPKVVLFTMTVIPSFVLPYYTAPSMLAVFVICITMIGFLAFVTWVLFGTIFKEFLQKHQKSANIIMALFLVYSAIMVSGVVELIKR